MHPLAHTSHTAHEPLSQISLVAHWLVLVQGEQMCCVQIGVGLPQTLLSQQLPAKQDPPQQMSPLPAAWHWEWLVHASQVCAPQTGVGFAQALLAQAHVPFAWHT